MSTGALLFGRAGARPVRQHERPGGGRVQVPLRDRRAVRRVRGVVLRPPRAHVDRSVRQLHARTARRRLLDHLRRGTLSALVCGQCGYSGPWL